jgi:hypothetical protein
VTCIFPDTMRETSRRSQRRPACDQFQFRFLGRSFPFHALPFGNVAEVRSEQRRSGNSDPGDRDLNRQLCSVRSHGDHL